MALLAIRRARDGEIAIRDEHEELVHAYREDIRVLDGDHLGSVEVKEHENRRIVLVERLVHSRHRLRGCAAASFAFGIMLGDEPIEIVGDGP